MAFDDHHPATGAVARVNPVDAEVDRHARLAGCLGEVGDELGPDVESPDGQLRKDHAEVWGGGIEVDRPCDRGAAEL